MQLFSTSTAENRIFAQAILCPCSSLAIFQAILQGNATA